MAPRQKALFLISQKYFWCTQLPNFEKNFSKQKFPKKHFLSPKNKFAKHTDTKSGPDTISGYQIENPDTKILEIDPNTSACSSLNKNGNLGESWKILLLRKKCVLFLFMNRFMSVRNIHYVMLEILLFCKNFRPDAEISA